MCSGEESGDHFIMSCCGNCGAAEVDDIKLKICTACKSIRYCGVKCQKQYRPKHKRACKQRLAEMRDEILFKQPESSYLGDCPICILPLSLGEHDSVLTACCGKVVCLGCHLLKRSPECPFCRRPEAHDLELLMKRADANDPNALRHLGDMAYKEKDVTAAFEYFTKGARLGDAGAHCFLAKLYREGAGVEKNKEKEFFHLEEAAIGGFPKARHLLAQIEMENRRYDRAVKHLIIAAKLGHDESIQGLKRVYAHSEGRRVLSKEDLATALRGYQTAVDATKSKQREEAKAALVRYQKRFGLGREREGR